MWAFLQQLSFWDWLALGTVLLILEVFGAGGYLLWIGLAAAAVGVAARGVRSFSPNNRAMASSSVRSMTSSPSSSTPVYRNPSDW